MDKILAVDIRAPDSDIWGWMDGRRQEMNPRQHSASTLGSSGDPRDERNRLSFMRLAVMVATTVFLASFAPPGLTLAAISSLAFISALVIATFALFYGERANAEHFTRWDEAAVMLALSLGVGLFVDPAAVEAAMAEAQQP